MEDNVLFCLLKYCQNVNSYNSKLRFLLLNIQKYITQSIFGIIGARQKSFCSVVSQHTGDI